MSRNERLIMMNATNNQLELGFNSDVQCRGNGRATRTGRVARAAWWFARMREIVEQAIDWSAVGEPPAEQIWIPGTVREVKV